MRVFATGASGFIGSAVVPELFTADHTVVGLARSDESAAAIEAAGADVHRGDLDDLDALRSGASGCDGVIHLAFAHGSSPDDAARADQAAIGALLDGLAGSGKPLVITSGTLALPPGRVGTERDVADGSGPAGQRVGGEHAALAGVERGVRSIVVRLAPSVHDAVRRGFVGALIDAARRTGLAGWVGDGSTSWPAVHRRDAARLFRLAVESAPAGTVLHGVAEEGVSTRAMAETIGAHLGVPSRPVPADEADEHFGWVAPFLSSDYRASSALTRELLGWEPTHRGLLADLENGHFFDPPQ